MDAPRRNELERKLRQQREALFKVVADTEADLHFIAEDRESELEERAQEERAARLFARLDDRGKRAIEDIDEALRRLNEGTFGTCAACRRPIDRARLEAFPAALLCINCARRRETGTPAAGTAAAAAASLPGDLMLLSERELEQALRELVREDGRVDMEELTIACRRGVVHLGGAVPCEAEHQILRQLLTDVGGIVELDDRLAVKEVLWEREDRTRARPVEEPPPWYEPPTTEDLVESQEEGIDYEPPAGPVSEEE